MKIQTEKDIYANIELISFNSYKKKKLRVLIFRKTCTACPTQYDIYDSWKMKVPKYYGRLRCGYFYVVKKPLDKPIYDFNFNEDSMKGCFNNEFEEIDYLKKACRKIWNKK